MLLVTNVEHTPALPAAARQLISPSEIKESLGPDRIRDFHDGRRLLVVDDNCRSREPNYH